MPATYCGDVQLLPVELTELDTTELLILDDEATLTTLLLLDDATEDDGTDDEAGTDEEATPSQLPKNLQTAHSLELVAGLSPCVHHLFS